MVEVIRELHGKLEFRPASAAPYPDRDPRRPSPEAPGPTSEGPGSPWREGCRVDRLGPVHGGLMHSWRGRATVPLILMRSDAHWIAHAISA